MTIEISFTYCDDADPKIEPPSRQTPGSAGFDIRANLRPTDRNLGMPLSRGEIIAVPTGIMLEVPDGTVCDVRSRSGLARNSGIVVLNAPGTLDSDFRGEVVVLLINHGRKDRTIEHGERIAQLVFLHSLAPKIRLVSELSHTSRGTEGFGSTGKS